MESECATNSQQRFLFQFFLILKKKNTEYRWVWIDKENNILDHFFRGVERMVLFFYFFFANKRKSIVNHQGQVESINCTCWWFFFSIFVSKSVCCFEHIIFHSLWSTHSIVNLNKLTEAPSWFQLILTFSMWRKSFHSPNSQITIEKWKCSPEFRFILFPNISLKNWS